jgi:hypothetical protein
MVRVPYVPTMGAVHPQAATAAKFNAVLSVSGTGRFLACDEDARWFTVKDEEVLARDVIHESGLTVLPALSTRGGRRTLTVYWYGQEPPARQAARWRAACGADTARVAWFQDHPQGADPAAAQDLLACRPVSPRPARRGTVQGRHHVHLARFRGGNGRRGPRVPPGPVCRGDRYRAGPGLRRGRADRRRGRAAERPD